jgi:hypothetical protein
VSNRREFLQGCFAVTGGLAASRAFAGAAFESRRLEPQVAIFDEGFAEGRAFAKAASALGMSTRAISGDVTALWYDDLYFRWQKHSAVVAGLTGASALFCLEKLAWDAGHRVVLRIDHTRNADGGVTHTFAGPSELLSSFTSLQARHPDLGVRVAQLITQCPVGRAGHAQRAVVSSSGAANAWCEPLVSWVIAPRHMT